MKTLKERIEREIERKAMQCGLMGSEQVSITFDLTDTEKEYFLDELSDIYNYEISGNELTITWSEE